MLLGMGKSILCWVFVSTYSITSIPEFYPESLPDYPLPFPWGSYYSVFIINHVLVAPDIFKVINEMLVMQDKQYGNLPRTAKFLSAPIFLGQQLLTVV